MKKLILFFALIGLVVLNSCKKDDDSPSDKILKLNLSGLEDLGSDYAYEGWIIVDGAPVSAGIFNVDASGNLSQTSFELNAEQLEKATTYILTIEPSPDTDPSPSSVHILAGDFSGNIVSLTTNHAAALGTDFSSAVGNYILATPSNGMNNDENSGVWWIDLSSGSPAAGLTLPTLPSGWKYEGWAVVDGTPLSTGKFSTASGADEAAPYSGPEGTPPFPGEDFLLNAPSNLTFPVDLAGKTVVISVEPDPDNSASPFLLKPLVGSVSASATDRTTYTMGNNATATNPTGTVSR